MRPYLFLIVCVLINGMVSHSQVPGDCIYQPSVAESLAYSLSIQDESALQYVNMDGRNYCSIRIMPHIVRGSDQSGGISLQSLQEELTKLDDAFSPMHFIFDVLPPDYIDNSGYYELITNIENIDSERQALFAHSSICNAVNIYFVNRFEYEGDRREGVSTEPTDCGYNNCDPFPDGCREGVIIDFQFPHGESAIQHEVGHYLGLKHTFSTCSLSECYENVDQVAHPNCREVTDLLCDTPADPGLGYQLTSDCEYQGVGTNCAQDSPCRDPFGDPYNPDASNYMSYALSSDGQHECRSRFSNEQISVSVYSFLEYRYELREELYTGQPSDRASLFVECLLRQNFYNNMPLQSVQSVDNGEVQEFLYLPEEYSTPEVGAIFLHYNFDTAYFVKGAIYAKYHYEAGGPEGELGFPVSDEGDALRSIYGTTGRYTRFENGSINYISSSPTHQGVGECYVITGPIFEAYEIDGFSSAEWAGFPTSSVYSVGNTDFMNVEERGYYRSVGGQPAQYFATTNPNHLVCRSDAELLRMILSWFDNSGIETSYCVMREDPSASRTSIDTLAILPPNSVSFDDATAQPGITYRYYVLATADTIYSPPSNNAFGRLGEGDWDIYLNAAEYYYDTEPGQGSGNLVTFPPTSDANLTVEANVANLSPGFHRVFLRYLDSRGVWSAPEGRSFYVTPPMPQGNLTINTAEVFYDSDPGVGQGSAISVTVDDEVAITASPDVSDLDPGFHRLYLRYRTNSNVWSAAEGRSFYVTPPVPAGGQVLASAEYYVDNDPGAGMGTAIDFADTSDVTLTHSVNPFAESIGFHRLFLRYQTSGGIWSAPEGRSLYVTSAQSDSLFIAGGEIFIDSLGSYGQGVAMEASDGNFDENEEDMHKYQQASVLTLGQHYVYARVRDNRGLWSNVLRDSFIVVIPEDIQLVASPEDSTGEHVRLVWTSFPEATEYHVLYDSLVTGTFATFITVTVPDTSVSLELIPDANNCFFKVIAILPSRSVVAKSPEAISRKNEITPIKAARKER
jgi:hypothetical protein